MQPIDLELAYTTRKNDLTKTLDRIICKSTLALSNKFSHQSLAFKVLFFKLKDLNHLILEQAKWARRFVFASGSAAAETFRLLSMTESFPVHEHSFQCSQESKQPKPWLQSQLIALQERVASIMPD